MKNTAEVLNVTLQESLRAGGLHGRLVKLALRIACCWRG